MPIPSGELVFTSDSGPRPLVWDLGIQDYSDWAWYLVAANLSDLAAAAASPLAITTSIEAPGSMAIQDIRDFFNGLREACGDLGIANAGGNLKSGPRFSCHASAVGMAPPTGAIRRVGASAGDLILVVGDFARFVSDYLAARRRGIGPLSLRSSQTLRRPRPRDAEMRILAAQGLLTAASDNSDGMIGALWNIANASNVRMRVDLGEQGFPSHILESSAREGYNPWNLFFFWGDWHVICTVAESSRHTIERIIRQSNIQATIIGSVVAGSPGIEVEDRGFRRGLRVVRNEGFIEMDFSNSPNAQFLHMLSTPVFSSADDVP